MPSAGAVEFLRVTDLHAFYDESHILHGIDFTVYRGEMVALLGRNGAGRTTTLRSILGLVGKRSGPMADASRRTPWRGLLPRRARHLLQPDHRREPDAASETHQRRHEPG